MNRRKLLGIVDSIQSKRKIKKDYSDGDITITFYDKCLDAAEYLLSTRTIITFECLQKLVRAELKKEEKCSNGLVLTESVCLALELDFKRVEKKLNKYGMFCDCEVVFPSKHYTRAVGGLRDYLDHNALNHTSVLFGGGMYD